MFGAGRRPRGARRAYYSPMRQPSVPALPAGGYCRQGSASRFWLSPARCRSSVRSAHPASSVEHRTRARYELELGSFGGSHSPAPGIADDCGSRDDESGCAIRASSASPRSPPNDTRCPHTRPKTCWPGSKVHRISGCHAHSRRSRHMLDSKVGLAEKSFHPPGDRACALRCGPIRRGGDWAACLGVAAALFLVQAALILPSRAVRARRQPQTASETPGPHAASGRSRSQSSAKFFRPFTRFMPPFGR